MISLNLGSAVKLLERWQHILDENKVVPSNFNASIDELESTAAETIREIDKLTRDSQELISSYYKNESN